MHQRRDLIILLILFLVLVIFTILGPGQSRDETVSSTPTTHSSAPGGTLALLRWTSMLGYISERLEYDTFELAPQDDALFIINPSEVFNRTQADIVLNWVEQGGTLILIDSRPSLFTPVKTMFQALNISIQGASATIERAKILQPSLHTPPINSILAKTDYIIAPDRDDVAHLVGTQQKDEDTNKQTTQPIIIGLKHGQGYIYISSASFPFTNEGLSDSDNASLVLNLLRRVPENGRILFDEWHHGFHTPPSLRSIVLSNPWGQALVYGLVVLALYLALTGRRFGHPIPVREEIALRSSAEYVESMAELFQRGRKRDFILHHYYTSFKRRLAKPYGISPRLDDEEFATELARYNDKINETDLLAQLRKLRQQPGREEQFIRTVAEATIPDTVERSTPH
jgi:hypothetical protein